MNAYHPTAAFWDGVFSEENPVKLVGDSRLPRGLADALEWLASGGGSILDFGCGNGLMLLLCAARQAVRRCVGIDLSARAVELARATADLNGLSGKAEFLCDTVQALVNMGNASFDGAILSNIIDNVLPEDAETMLDSIHRTVKPRGKILVKLNPFLTEDLISQYGLVLIKDNCFLEKDGIFLRNLETREWRKMLEQRFTISEYSYVYYREADTYNRLFLLVNK